MGETRSRTRTVVIATSFAALLGIGVFGLLAWRSVTVQRAEPDQAASRFALVRERYAGMQPILRVQEGGRILRRTAPEGEMRAAKRLYALAYRTSERRLLHAEVPFWFLKVKGPAMQVSLRETGFDLQRLGITAAELQRYGPSLVLDETSTNGDTLLVWTE